MRILASVALALLLGACADYPPPQPMDMPGAYQPTPSPPAGPAEAETAATLQKIAILNPALHAVIVTDPTAVEQARQIDQSGKQGPK